MRSAVSFDMVLSIAAAALCSVGKRFVLHTISSRKSITDAFSFGSLEKSWNEIINRTKKSKQRKLDGQNSMACNLALNYLRENIPVKSCSCFDIP